MKQLQAKVKRLHKSLTLWFNLVGATLLSGLLLDPMITTWLLENNLALVIVLGNILLRFKTTKALENK